MKWQDGLGRALMALIVVLTIAAFLDGIGRMGIAASDRIWIETGHAIAFAGRDPVIDCHMIVAPRVPPADPSD